MPALFAKDVLVAEWFEALTTARTGDFISAAAEGALPVGTTDGDVGRLVTAAAWSFSDLKKGARWHWVKLTAYVDQIQDRDKGGDD